jgi:hypothetical protein
MSLRRAKVTAPLGLGGAEFEKEAQSVKPGCVRYFERTINGISVLVLVVNRKDGFKIMTIGDGGVRTLYGEENDGKEADGE